MSDTYSYEVLEPGGHARLVGNVLDRISRASANPASAVGSAAALLGDAETASWMERTTAADGAALIEAIYGNTLRWNQLVVSPNDGTNWLLASGSCFDKTDNQDGSISLTVVDNTATQGVLRVVAGSNFVSGHKYLAKAGISGHSSNTRFNLLDNWAACGSSIDAIAATSAIVTATENSLTSPYFSITISRGSMAVGTVITIKHPQLFDLTAMFGSGNEPATVAEFEALFPEPYYPYDAGSLLPVRMEGVETVGFNQWDEQWELGSYNNTNGEKIADTTRIRCKNLIPVFPDTDYYLNFGSYSLGTHGLYIYFYDANGDFLSFLCKWSAGLTTPTGAYYMTWRTEPTYGTTYQNDICINISDPARNGTYEPYWSSQLATPVSTYFPGGLRSAGSVRDELRADAAITRVGAVDLGTLTWTYTSGGYFYADIRNEYPPMALIFDALTCSKYATSTINNASTMPDKTIKGSSTQSTIFVKDSDYTDAATLKAAMSGVILYYALATPTTQPIDPPLPLSYRVGADGTERVMVASGTQSAPPIFATRYPLDPTDLAASIAPRESAVAESNHAVDDLIMLGWTLCKVTTAIARGESITIGTNVTRTSVAAEMAALSE